MKLEIEIENELYKMAQQRVDNASSVVIIQYYLLLHDYQSEQTAMSKLRQHYYKNLIGGRNATSKNN